MKGLSIGGVKVYHLSSGKSLPEWLSDKKKEHLKRNNGTDFFFFFFVSFRFPRIVFGVCLYLCV